MVFLTLVNIRLNFLCIRLLLEAASISRDTSLMYYVLKSGDQKGPYEDNIILACLKEGAFNYSDLVWKEGWPDWKTIEEVFPRNAASLNISKNDVKNYSDSQTLLSKAKSNSHYLWIVATTAAIFGSLGAWAVVTFTLKRQSNNTTANLPAASKEITQKSDVNAPPRPSIQKQTPQQSPSWNEELRQINKGIDENDPKAMAIMANWLRLGYCGHDIDKALQLATYASKENDLFGKYVLGRVYQLLEKPESNTLLIEAFPAIRDLAIKGDCYAQIMLAAYYREGLANIPQDKNEAWKWFVSAAKQGNAQAQYIVGSMYEIGDGLNYYPQESYTWLRKAADQNFSSAQRLLGASNRINLSTEERHDWLLKAANNGNEAAQYDLADYLAHQRKHQEAIPWFHKACDQKVPEAYYAIAKYYDEGEFVEKDEQKAYEYFTLAANSPRYMCVARSDVIGEAASKVRDKNNARVRNEKAAKTDKDRVEAYETAIADLVRQNGYGIDGSIQFIRPELLKSESGVLDTTWGNIQRMWPSRSGLVAWIDYHQYSESGTTSTYILRIQKPDPNRRKYFSKTINGFYETGKNFDIEEGEIPNVKEAFSHFKEWESKFKSENITGSYEKKIGKVIFCWDGKAANISAIRGAMANGEDVEDILYVLNQINDMKDALRSAQKQLKANSQKSKSDIDRLFN